jgi:hypothetical protein
VSPARIAAVAQMVAGEVERAARVPVMPDPHRIVRPTWCPQRQVFRVPLVAGRWPGGTRSIVCYTPSPDPSCGVLDWMPTRRGVGTCWAAAAVVGGEWALERLAT